MSYSSNRRDALDVKLPLNHRVSHARSCAMLVAQKWKVLRSVVLETVNLKCGVDLNSVTSEHEIEPAIRTLEQLRMHGIS